MTPSNGLTEGDIALIKRVFGEGYNGFLMGDVSSQKLAALLAAARTESQLLAESASYSSHGERVSYSQTEFDECGQIGERDGYERAVADIDRLTGGDGEFYVSTVPGRGCSDVETMKARIVERFNQHPGDSPDIVDQDGNARARVQLSGESGEDCERCQGNGEIVTDWDRYRTPHDGDAGDEAVAPCPDCDGQGTVAASPPSPNGDQAVQRQLTHAKAAMFMTYIAKNAAAWAGDLLTLPEQAAQPVSPEAMARFVAGMQSRLNLISSNKAP